MPDMRIGDYEVREEPIANILGGAVYEGVDPKSGELFLFKEVQNGDKRSDSIWNFEVTSNIYVPVNEVRQSNRRFLVVNRPNGLPLTKCEHCLRNNLYGWSLFLQAMAQICLAVENLHANGIVHGSINPGMIFIDTDGDVKNGKIASLVCFEPFTSKNTEDYLAEPNILPFFSQEQIRGAGGSFSDIYAIGMVLHATLSKIAAISSILPATEKAKTIVFGDIAAFQPDLEVLPFQLKEALEPFMPLLEGVVSGALQRIPESRFDSPAYIRQHLKELSARIEPLALAQHYTAQKDYEAAAFILEDAITNYPVRGNLLLGRLYSDFLMDYEKGVIAYKRALKALPNLQSARTGLIHLYMRFKRLNLAQREIMGLLNHNPNDIEVLTLYANYLKESGNIDGALNIYKQIEDLNPYHLPTYITAIKLNIEHERFSVANQVCNRALERIVSIIELGNLNREQVAEIYALHAQFLQNEGRLQRAISWYEKAIKQYPFNVKSHLNLAELYQATGQMDRSIKHFLAAITATPGDQGMLAGMNELLNQFRTDRTEN
jgi:tetratricopeptide (TPR) repeat protein